MDTYTKMCDCPEIRKLWTKHVGDRITNRISGISFILLPHHLHEPEIFKDIIWLPHQEDIQNMLSKEIEFDYDTTIDRWCNCVINNYEMRTSLWRRKPGILTEFWLVFYMYTIHNKHWTDKGWV